MSTNLTRATRRSRIWITLLSDQLLIEWSQRENTSIDDLKVALDEMKKRVTKLESAAKGLAARLQKA